MSHLSSYRNCAAAIFQSTRIVALIETFLLVSLFYSVIAFIFTLYDFLFYIGANAEEDKREVLKENRGKCGIYKRTNLLSGDIYIGSSMNLGNRLGQYYTKKYLERILEKGNSIICASRTIKYLFFFFNNIFLFLYIYIFIKKKKINIFSPTASLLKNGLSNFSLEILEYCTEVGKVIDREQYYIDLLQPKYNIFPVAGSSSCYKHSSETKEKFKVLGLGLKNLEHLKNLHARLRDNPALRDE